MSAFVAGQELSRRFYAEAVRPMLVTHFPDLAHSAALLGRGSEVLGYDDAMSGDHNWEPRVIIFLRENDHASVGDAVTELVGDATLREFAGRPSEVTVTALADYVGRQLDLDLSQPITARDWLTLPEQRLIMVTAGAVFHDEVGLQDVRDRLAYYPRDVWLYLMISAWWRIHPENNLVGRTGYAGDELGSALLGARLVHDIMTLAFLLERRYAPYKKWFGTAFSRLDCAAALGPVLTRVLRAERWPDREAALMEAYDQLGSLHNALGVTPPVETETVQLWDRPFRVRWPNVLDPLAATISDPEVRAIREQWPVGGIDEVRDILAGPAHRRRLLGLLDQPTS